MKLTKMIVSTLLLFTAWNAHAVIVVNAWHTTHREKEGMTWVEYTTLKCSVYTGDPGADYIAVYGFTNQCHIFIDGTLDLTYPTLYSPELSSSGYVIRERTYGGSCIDAQWSIDVTSAITFDDWTGWGTVFDDDSESGWAVCYC